MNQMQRVTNSRTLKEPEMEQGFNATYQKKYFAEQRNKRPNRENITDRIQVSFIVALGIANLSTSIRLATTRLQACVFYSTRYERQIGILIVHRRTDR